jgi:hypothetical protein
MCCFSGPVPEVLNTRIFARMGQRGHQVLVYQMALEVPEHLAMILPVPVARGAGEKAMQFFDLSKYPAFFADLHALYPVPRARSGPPTDPFGAPDQVGARLAVIAVGAFEASFVPGIADFHRLDARFRLPDQVWDELPGYADYGFAVFKLKKGKGEAHPMAFSFPSADPKKLFFPTLHIHDGKVHDKERFDHTLYMQGSRAEMGGGWEESAGLASSRVRWQLTHGMVRPELHVLRRLMRGTFPNGDVVLALA